MLKFNQLKVNILEINGSALSLALPAPSLPVNYGALRALINLLLCCFIWGCKQPSYKMRRQEGWYVHIGFHRCVAVPDDNQLGARPLIHAFPNTYIRTILWAGKPIEPTFILEFMGII